MNSCLETLQSRFDQRGIAYEVIEHPQAATTQQASAAAGISGYSFAKPVVLMVDEQPQLFVLHAADRIDIDAVRRAMGSSTVRIAEEYEVHPLFPGCETGGIPAVPLREEMRVYLDRKVAADPEIVFEVGSSTQAVRMRMADYIDLVDPRVLEFAHEPAHRRRRTSRAFAWRRRAMQIVPFLAAAFVMLLGSRLRRGRRSSVRSFALGLMAGATTSTLTDPRSGGRRRALLRDKPRRWMRRITRDVDNRGRYFQGKARGLRHYAGEVQHRLADAGRRGARPA